MKPKAIYLGEPGRLELAYGAAEYVRLAADLQFVAPAQTVASLSRLGAVREGIEVIVTTWGMPCLDADFLRRAGHLPPAVRHHPAAAAGHRPDRLQRHAAQGRRHRPGPRRP